MENEFLKIFKNNINYEKKIFYLENGLFFEALVFTMKELSLKKYKLLKENYTVLYSKYKSFLKDDIKYLYTDSFYITNTKVFVITKKSVKRSLNEDFYKVCYVKNK